MLTGAVNASGSRRPNALGCSAGRLALLGALATVCVALTSGPATAAQQGTVWLCKPGLKDNPCGPSLSTTRLSNDGQTVLGKYTPPKLRHPRLDCFYIYPTVSDDKSDNSDLSIDPEERSIALYQAARYSERCRVFAPMYRQVTITRLLKGPDTITPKMQRIAYQSALAGWKDYLEHYNHGRPFVLIGHSQGSFTLRKLIAEQIDQNAKLRHQLVSAILLGGNVLVKKHHVAGGDFKNIPACQAATQLHCVIAFSTFNAPVPQDAIFGRVNGSLGAPPDPTLKVLCAYPGDSHLKTIIPTQPFAPGTTIGAATTAVGFPRPNVPTAWAELDHAYTGGCSSAGGANVLQIADNPNAFHLRAIPDATWGLHLTDANIALGNLTHIVKRETQAYVQR
jgi:hypothetical protein